LDVDAEGALVGTVVTTPEAISPAEMARVAYRSALRRLEPARLKRVAEGLGLDRKGERPSALVDAIEARWDDHAGELLQDDRVGKGARALLSLLAMTDSPTWPRPAASLALELLGFEPTPALNELEALGAIVTAGDEGGATTVHAHPGILVDVPPPHPEGPAPAPVKAAQQVREADGLELVLRLASLWQRLGDGPARQTQQGTLYKRDRDRLEEDAGLAGPIADALEPLPDLVPLLLSLAERVGLVVVGPGGERLDPAPADYWAEHGVHLSHMLATAWLGLTSWHEVGGAQEPGSPTALTLPFVRPVVLLWMARLEEGKWLALDDLARHLRDLAPGWSRLLLGALGPSADPEQLLAAVLLGPAYQLGLVRAAEETGTGRRVVQLTELGRYVLGVGPHPHPRAEFPQFLFVQPNFEVIAYRQGLSPGLIGQLARFARWTRVGAALELQLTAESIYRGLEGGLTADAVLERLTRHSARPLPPSVVEAVRTWSARRDRVTFYSAATLVEFASSSDLERALRDWPAHASGPPLRLAERLLLVEDDRAIPFARFKLAGSRDYRRPAEACVKVGADGLTLTLDPNLSDLLIDAELARFADEKPGDDLRRRFVVSRESLARGMAEGLSVSVLGRWFERRVGSPMSAAMRLLLHASQPKVEPVVASQPIVLKLPTADLLDGLWQHPETRPYLDERLGPTAAVVVPGSLDGLKRVLARLGVPLKLGTDVEA
jgi:hypothetical protein